MIQTEKIPQKIQDHLISHRISNSFRVASEFSPTFNQDPDTPRIEYTIFGCIGNVLPLGFLVSQ